MVQSTDFILGGMKNPEGSPARKNFVSDGPNADGRPISVAINELPSLALGKFIESGLVKKINRGIPFIEKFVPDDESHLVAKVHKGG